MVTREQNHFGLAQKESAYLVTTPRDAHVMVSVTEECHTTLGKFLASHKRTLMECGEHSLGLLWHAEIVTGLSPTKVRLRLAKAATDTRAQSKSRALVLCQGQIRN